MKLVLLNESKGSKEDYWMKTLRNICPYGLNERATKHNSEVPVEKSLFSIPRTKQRSVRYRNNNLKKKIFK